jgi:hypothetical protein
MDQASSETFYPAFAVRGHGNLPAAHDTWTADQVSQDQAGLESSRYPAAYAPDRLAHMQHRMSSIEMAPRKGEDSNGRLRSKAGSPPASLSSETRPAVIGRARSSKSVAPPIDVNGYGYAPAAGDLNLLARALYAEFSTVSNWRDMQAGAWSMLNRIRPNGRWPHYRTIDTIGTSLLDVLNKRTRDGTPQYSFVPQGGIGAPGGSERWQESAHPQTLTGSARQAWMWAMDTAKRVLGGSDWRRNSFLQRFARDSRHRSRLFP